MGINLHRTYALVHPGIAKSEDREGGEGGEGGEGEECRGGGKGGED